MRTKVQKLQAVKTFWTHKQSQYCKIGCNFSLSKLVTALSYCCLLVNRSSLEHPVFVLASDTPMLCPSFVAAALPQKPCHWFFTKFFDFFLKNLKWQDDRHELNLGQVGLKLKHCSLTNKFRFYQIYLLHRINCMEFVLFRSVEVAKIEPSNVQGCTVF